MYRHNGAGKTTLMHIMACMYEPTSGQAEINGFDCKQDMSAVRQSLGVCPQHDVLFAELTVVEHLQIFAGLKGLAAEEAEQEVQEKIAEVGLTEKANVRSSNLSGGQKRKLSLAISLIGNSTAVFLDEPTSGMDPYSRRSTWNILQSNREGRALILTTHFMDEADVSLQCLLLTSTLFTTLTHLIPVACVDPRGPNWDHGRRPTQMLRLVIVPEEQVRCGLSSHDRQEPQLRRQPARGFN